MQDFPAAHSMDTAWYAVDRDGRVTHAWTDETGPLPEAACKASWVVVYLELLVARIVAARETWSEPAHDPVEHALVTATLAGDEHAHLVYADWREARGRRPETWDPRARAIYRVEDDAFRAVARAALPSAWSGVIVFTTAEQVDDVVARHPNLADDWRDTHEQLGLPHALAVYEIDEVTFADAWANGAVAAFAIETIPEPHDVGFYEYAHCFLDRDYVCTATPPVPLSIAELPAPLRERLSELGLPLRFADARRFLPEDHTSCHTWGDD